MGNESVKIMVFFLFGRGVEGRSEGIFFRGEVLLDHGKLADFITANCKKCFNYK